MVKKNILVMQVFSAGLFLLYLAYRKIRGRGRTEEQNPPCQLTPEQQERLWNRTFFFPDQFPETRYSTTRQMIFYLQQADSTLQVCMYRLNFRMLEDVLVEVATSGVAVRVITNARLPQIKRQRFTNAGIQTRSKRHILQNVTDDLMHHKFVVIDRHAAMVGSLNWTLPGITAHFENVVLTTNSNSVDKLSNVFEKLWREETEE